MNEKSDQQQFLAIEMVELLGPLDNESSVERIRQQLCDKLQIKNPEKKSIEDKREQTKSSVSEFFGTSKSNTPSFEENPEKYETVKVICNSLQNLESYKKKSVSYFTNNLEKGEEVKENYLLNQWWWLFTGFRKIEIPISTVFQQIESDFEQKIFQKLLEREIRNCENPYRIGVYQPETEYWDAKLIQCPDKYNGSQPETFEPFELLQDLTMEKNKSLRENPVLNNLFNELAKKFFLFKLKKILVERANKEEFFKEQKVIVDRKFFPGNGGLGWEILQPIIQYLELDPEEILGNKFSEIFEVKREYSYNDQKELPADFTQKWLEAMVRRLKKWTVNEYGFREQDKDFDTLVKENNIYCDDMCIVTKNPIKLSDFIPIEPCDENGKSFSDWESKL